MTKIIITGINNEKKIQAIKGIRGVTDLGLREAKDIADAVATGEEREIFAIHDPAYLEEHDVKYREVFERENFDFEQFVEALGKFPNDMTVGTLYDILIVVQKKLI